MNYKKITVKVLIYIPVIFLAFLIFINLWLGITKAVTRNPVPKFLGFSTMYVLSGSMEPSIHTGDLVIIKEKDISEYKIGDIVTFIEHSNPYTHRIIEANDGSFTTKGDANNKADEPISSSKIQGEVILRIPKIGIIAMLCKTPTGILIMFLIVVLITYSGDLYRKFRRKIK